MHSPHAGRFQKRSKHSELGFQQFKEHHGMSNLSKNHLDLRVQSERCLLGRPYTVVPKSCTASDLPGGCIGLVSLELLLGHIAGKPSPVVTKIRMHSHAI